MQDQILQLIHDAESGHYSRRSLLKRAAGLGLSLPAAAALFAGVVPLSALAQDATPGSRRHAQRRDQSARRRSHGAP